MTNQFINLKEGDSAASIYRIVSCERFLQILHDQQNGLVLPWLWDDPFENFILKALVITPDGKTATIRFRDKLYGQCWSLHKEIDLMWRSYSPGKDAVKLESKVSTLFRSLFDRPGKYREISCFIGRVEYFRKERIREVLKIVTFLDPSAVAIADK
jgi:hypothetical protein